MKYLQVLLCFGIGGVFAYFSRDFVSEKTHWIISNGFFFVVTLQGIFSSLYFENKNKKLRALLAKRGITENES